MRKRNKCNLCYY